MDSSNDSTHTRLLQLRTVIRRRWRVALLTLLLILALPLTLFNPIGTARGAVVNTGLTVAGGGISIDAGRIAFLNGTLLIGPTFYWHGYVVVYDTLSGSSTSFLPPAGGEGGSFQPVISGDKIVIASEDSTGSGFGIFYCVLPRVVPLVPCGPWTLVVTNPDTAPPFLFKGDIVVWSTSSGFSYYRFSSGTVTTVVVPGYAGDTGGLNLNTISTNGEVVAFTAKLTGSPSRTLMYYDILEPLIIANTGLPAGVQGDPSRTFMWENLVVFSDNSTMQNRIRYYDILTGQSSPAGTGPIGLFGVGTQAVWADRAVFLTSESDLSFDCGASPGIQSGEFCVQYWNLRPRPWQASLIVPNASPLAGEGVGGCLAGVCSGLPAVPIGIYGNIIVFTDADHTIQYLTVPMRGDVNLDGIVNVQDLALVGGCFMQTIKGTAC